MKKLSAVDGIVAVAAVRRKEMSVRFRFRVGVRFGVRSQ